MDEEFEGVDLKLLEVLLEVAYDLYQSYDEVGGNRGWTFREIRRISSQWPVEVLQAVLQEGMQLKLFHMVGYKLYLTEYLLAKLDNHQTSWYIVGTSDLFEQVFRIERNIE